MLTHQQLGGIRRRRRNQGSVLTRAISYWKASTYSGAGDLLDPVSAHNMQLGSTAGADTNDPLFLDKGASGSYFYSPGVAGNTVSVPNNANLVSATMDLRICCRMEDWTPAAEVALAGIFGLTVPTESYILALTATGALRFYYVSAAAVVRNSVSTAIVPFADTTGGWLRVTRDSVSGQVKYYTSVNYDPDTLTGVWTQLGTTIAGVAEGMQVGTAPFVVGEQGGDASPTGRFYRVQYFSDITETTKRLDMNFGNGAYNAALTSGTALTGQVMTINRAGTGRKSAIIERNTFMLNTDDYFETASHADLNFGAGVDFTVIAVVRTYTTAATQVLIAKLANSGVLAGWSLTDVTGVATALYRDGTTSSTDAGGNMTAGLLSNAAMVRSGATIEAWLNGVSGGSSAGIVTDVSGVSTVRIGSYSNSVSSVLIGEFYGAAIFRSALSALEIETAAAELLAA